MEEGEGRPVVVVTVGTDHHPFGRLITWMDDWAWDHPEFRCIVQHGMSSPPLHAEAIDFLGKPDLMDLLAGAAAVVCQAGPGSILDARRAGIVPLVVPRLQRLGEVVDDHQVAFAEAMASRGEAIVADTAESIAATLAEILAAPDSVRRPAAPSPAAATGLKVEAALTAAAVRPSGLLNLGRLRDIASRRRRPN